MEKTHIREDLTSDIIFNKQTAGLPTSSAQKFQYSNEIHIKLQSDR